MSYKGAYPDTKIIGRILDMANNGELLGYVIIDTSGKTKSVNLDEAIRLAKAYKFINATAHKDGDTWMLKGEGDVDISNLPIYKLKKS